MIEDRSAHPRRTATAVPVATFSRATGQRQAVERQAARRLHMEQPKLVAVAAGSLDGQAVVAGGAIDRDRRRNQKRRRPKLGRVQPRVE